MQLLSSGSAPQPPGLSTSPMPQPLRPAGPDTGWVARLLPHFRARRDAAWAQLRGMGRILEGAHCGAPSI